MHRPPDYFQSLHRLERAKDWNQINRLAEQADNGEEIPTPHVCVERMQMDNAKEVRSKFR